MTSDKMKYEFTDEGFCRAYFSWKNPQNQKIMYCWQLESDTVARCYRCSEAPDHEPDYEVYPLVTPDNILVNGEVNYKLNKFFNNRREVKGR